MNREGAFCLPESTEKRYHKKEPWQKPWHVFLAQDEPTRQAFTKWQEEHPGDYRSSSRWLADEPDGQAALDNAQSRHKSALAAALTAGKALPVDVLADLWSSPDLRSEWMERVQISPIPREGNWKKVVTKDSFLERQVLLYKGYNLGIVCDGHILLPHRKAAEEILKPIIDRAKLHPGELQRKMEEGTYPDISRAWPPMEVTHRLTVIGNAFLPYVDGSVKVYLTDGKDVWALSSDYLALVRRYHPDAEMRGAIPTGPVVFVRNEEKVALVMPLSLKHLQLPDVLLEAVKTVVPENGPRLDFDYVYRIAEDKGNQHMRAENRSAWNTDDFAAAMTVFYDFYMFDGVDKAGEMFREKFRHGGERDLR